MKFRTITSLLIYFILLPDKLCLNGQNKPVFLAHYMPWHQTPAVSGYWGWHWTMNHFDPDKIDQNGCREIASHFYPLTGPYDSQDEHILEYHALLMKISGIDGVLVDWYGMEDFWDYGVLNESTHALFDAVSQAGLKFSIVYEDQTIIHMVDNEYLQQDEALAHGQQVMNYLQENWFTTNSYMRLNNRPVLLTFGPQYFHDSTDWETMFSGLPIAPVFFSEDNRLAPVAAGAYPWPPMWKTGADGILSEAELTEYLRQFYQKAASWEYLVASVFPGFMDIYKEAGVNDGYGILEAREGATLKLTLQKSIESNPSIIQLVTWNDFGEGTIIEPTVEFGYQYLEIVQDQRIQLDSTFIFKPKDLRLPYRIWNLRIEHKDNPAMNIVLDDIFDLIIKTEIERATFLIDSLTGHTAIDYDDTHVKIPNRFSLMQNYPNPFNQSTRIAYKIYRGDAVNISVYDVNGRVVDVLVDDYQSTGNYSTIWNAPGISSGIYFYRITVGPDFAVKKCLKVD
jgi:hypothetical protein